MAEIVPQSISSNLAAMGISQPAAGGRFAYFFPELSHGGLGKLEQSTLGFLFSNPPTNPIAAFLNSGGFSKKQGKPGLIDLQHEQQTMAKVASGAAEYMRFAAADIQPTNFGNIDHGLGRPSGGNAMEVV